MVTMDDSFEPVGSMPMVGGDLSLDFVNTGSGREEGPFRERLATYEDIVVWGERSGAIDGATAERLVSEAAERPGEASRVLERGRELREAIYGLFTATGGGIEVAQGDLDVLNRELVRASEQRVVAASGGTLAWRWTADSPLDRVLAVVAAAAADLATGAAVERVKECGGTNCNWLFRDTSRNRSRRWCDMRDCGNRAKARRYYARHRHEDG